MLPSALKKSAGTKDEKQTRCVTFSRENSYIENSYIENRETESFLTVAALKVEKENMKQVDNVDAMMGEDEVDGGIFYEDEASNGKKVLLPTDSLRRHRERLSSKNSDD